MTVMVFVKAMARFRGNREARAGRPAADPAFVLHDKLLQDSDSPFFDAA